ncbi:hypothetical protein ANCCAN_15547 [Ancylostoma caninum]|uniref:Uncharacterized protein n=1 Tax=Ancylostoma caninum TaxID=29170 RepID=A0A368G682_ANCCA|nr:hypothetical protein ANCCAN_15547 [Ancylostoma caninum]
MEDNDENYKSGFRKDMLNKHPVSYKRIGVLAGMLAVHGCFFQGNGSVEKGMARIFENTESGLLTLTEQHG